MPSKSAKQRKYNRKVTREQQSVKKTELSRARRLANKAKREAIHKINPNLKITIVNGVTYTDDGINGKVAVKIINGKIRSYDNEPEVIKAADEDEVNVMQSNGNIGKEIDTQIEKERLGVFSKFAGKFRRK